MRHPPLSVEAGVCYGGTEVPLAMSAESGAHALAQRLEQLGVPAVQRLLSSPLTRCATVAAWLAQQWGCAWQADERLREMHFGVWEGQRWDAIARSELDAWAVDFMTACPHGGESVAQFAARVAQWLEALRQPLQEAQRKVAPVHVVTHAGVMRAVAAQVLALPLERCLSWSLEMGSVVWLRWDEATGDGSLVRWNG